MSRIPSAVATCSHVVSRSPSNCRRYTEVTAKDEWSRKRLTCSTDGIWAAGDASDVLYKQNNVSAGDAVKAVLNIDSYLHEREETREYVK